ncbi:hypothetical protein O4H50_05810 [Vibrio diazotrophicus]|uniref:hypothetical protein n=1 Tax=Vibrio diazotrophicus TaxID=685 RepID=UPI0005A96399|nr:hypothetical protein [Vibrio diazotrophicus]MCZ4371301.1 hypothetical protein [Vibrio diazotrophicus]
MKLLFNLLLAAIGSVIAFSLIVIFILTPLMQWYSENKPPIGSSIDDHFIRIQGIKPADAQVIAHATFYGGGEECSSFFWSASDGKKRQGGKGVFKIEHDFSTTADRYELRIPYQNYLSSGCDMQLWQITIGARNAFDTVGFADLRIYKPANEWNKALSFDAIIEARQCNSFIHQWKDNTWSGGLGCYFYFDGQKISEKPEYNAGQVYFDFSQFNDDTVIHYDILAGENYRSESLDPQTGK